MTGHKLFDFSFAPEDRREPDFDQYDRDELDEEETAWAYEDGPFGKDWWEYDDPCE